MIDFLYSLPAKTISQLMEEAGGVSRIQERQHSQRVPAGRSQLAVVQLVQQVTIIKPGVNIVYRFLYIYSLVDFLFAY